MRGDGGERKRKRGVIKTQKQPNLITNPIIFKQFIYRPNYSIGLQMFE